MQITRFSHGNMTVELHALDCERIAHACASAVSSARDPYREGIDQMQALFTFGALACNLYGRTAGDDKDDAAAKALLAKIGG